MELSEERRSQRQRYAEQFPTPAKTPVHPGDSPVWRQRPQFTLRTTPHRFDDIRVPWRPTLDATLSKRFALPHGMRFDFRAEAFNLTNIAIFAAPNTNANEANFGKILDPKESIYFPRNIQLGFKLFF